MARNSFQELIAALTQQSQQARSQAAQPSVAPVSIQDLIQANAAGPFGQAVPGGLIPSQGRGSPISSAGVSVGNATPFKANPTQNLINLLALRQRRRRAAEFARKEQEKAAKANSKGGSK